MRNDKAEGEILMIAVIAIIVIVVILLGAAAGIASFAGKWLGNGADTVMKETQPSTLLAKYRLMLQQQNSLEELKTNIGVYQGQLESIQRMYPANTSRRDWARDDREQYDNIQNAVSASKITFNNLAEQYNAEQKDISWAFCNQATLPTGATVVLNREYVPYVTGTA
jgi:Tfp pilus assembly protein PilO